MIIDCEKCELYQSEHCRDCFVMAVLSRQGAQVDLDPEEQRAISCLQDAGLAPVLKFRQRAG